MPDLVSQILDVWRSRRQQGEEVSLEEVVSDHPELGGAELLEAARRRSMQDTPGTQLDTTIAFDIPQLPGFHDIRVLRTGGMGQTFVATQDGLNRRCLLKVALDEKNAARFRREIQINGRLHHKHIADAYAIQQDAAGRTYLVLEYIAGEDLYHHVRRVGPLPFDEACRLTSEIAQGLEHAHAQGILHRDIKPSNVVLSPQGEAKIVDWGAARVMTPRSEAGDEDVKTVHFIGTPAYASPEQRSDPSGVDERADVFSLGCTLYFMLTGERPPDEVFHEGKLPPPSALRKDVPPRIDRIVARMTTTADQRLRMQDVARLLEESNSGRAPARSKFAFVAMTASVLAVALLLVAFAAWRMWPLVAKTAVTPDHQVEVSPVPVPPVEDKVKLPEEEPDPAPMEPPVVPREEPPPREVPKPRPPLGRNAPKITCDATSGKLTPQPAGAALRMELAGHSGPIRAGAFSREGRWLATGADDQTVRLWDLKEGKPAGVLRGYPRSVQAVAFSGDGRRLAFSGAGYTTNVVCVWDLQEESLEAAFTLSEDVSPSGVKALVFSPNHKLLACAGTGPVRIWDVEKQAVLHTLPWQETFPSYSYDVAFSPDGTLVAAGCHGGGGPDSRETVRVWNMASGELEHTFVGDSGVNGLSHSEVRGAVAFSHDGASLLRVTQSTDRFSALRRGGAGPGGFREVNEEGSLMSWPLAAPKPTSQPLASGNTYALAVNEKQMFVASARGTSRFGARPSFPGDAPAAPLDQIELWSSDGKTARFASKHEPTVTMLRISRDGKLLVTGGEDNTARLWDVPAVFAGE